MNDGALRFLNPAPPGFSAQQVIEIAHRFFKLEGEITSLESERDLNYRINAANGRSCILKVSNVREDAEQVDMQIRAMQHMIEHDPALPIPQVIRTLDGNFFDWCVDSDGARHMVRAITVLPGVNLIEVDRNPVLLEDVGSVVGRACLALQGFFHPAASYELLWDIRALADIVPFVIHIKDSSLRYALQADLDSTIRHILPRLSGMRSQVIHNDANTVNLLCEPDDLSKVSGLVDFGDMMHAPLIQDLAVAAGSIALSSKSPVEEMCRVVMGFDRVNPLLDDEIDILSHLAVARVAQETLIAAKRVSEDSEMNDYLGGGATSNLSALDLLLSCGHDEIRRQFRRACRFPVYCPKPEHGAGDVEAQKDLLLKRRRRFLGEELELSYEDPIHVVRSQGVWVYDAAGVRHLDAYNNVPHVGHCHPHVVRAVSRQLATMNSNTRYLYENIVEYAERLSLIMPGELRASTFVNSGSEANDAALQIARTVTGNRGVLIVESAYHGITESIMGLSPSIQDTDTPVLPEDVRTIAAPNNTSQDYLESVEQAIASLKADGKTLAAFMVDCSLSSNGIADIPKDYLPGIAELVRRAGGLIIADEVQIGFGRCGTHMWGIEAQGVVPDIITLGKPMGNGIAIGAVVTTPEIHHRFTSQTDFFSTFGGNPVACAAAGAVLDVLERENLMENARLTGQYLRRGIARLAERFPQIRSVNGMGLFIGVEISTPDETVAIVNYMRKNGTLISTASSNTLKIRPPLAFHEKHADILVLALERALIDMNGAKI